MLRNPHFAKFKAGYLFPEITKRKNAFLQEHPDAKLLSLGIGDTTQPLVPSVVRGLVDEAKALGTKEGYTGYGHPQGDFKLREEIASKLYYNRVTPDEIFLSDGAKCDIGRLQVLFGQEAAIAVQDPTYPVYIDTSIAVGQKEPVTMPCTPENGFFPDLENTPRTDLIFFCSPNNPTGAVATKEQLKSLVDFAKKNRSIIIFDSAYAFFIQDSSLPKSIYEIEGAKEVAIEVGSFSKMAGFTGVRLGWSIVPKELSFDDKTPVWNDWSRMSSTFFNCPCNIAESGGKAVLNNLAEVGETIGYYMENAALLKNAMKKLGFKVFGGEHAPYIWVEFPGRKSWEVFDELLEKYHLITTPGIGFGSAGESFVRFSAFANLEDVRAAVNRILTQRI